MSITNTKTYNGWTNYETWAVALHLDNDQGTYSAVRERADDLKRDAAGESGTLTSARYELADWLKDFAETLCGIGDESDDYGIAEPSLLAMDMIRAALDEVDWDEIARNVLSES